jgi:6-phosphogluconolactonase
MLRFGIAGVLLAVALGVTGCGSDSDENGDASSPQGDAAIPAGSGGVHGGSGSMAGTGGAAVSNDASVQHDSGTRHDAGSQHDGGSAHDASMNTQDDTGTSSGSDAGDAGASAPLIVYAGNYGMQIDIFTMDPDTLALEPAGNVASGNGPSFLAFDAQHQRLVACDENANTIESFAITAGTGALESVDSESSSGNGPTHVTFDQTGKWILTANYNSGSVAVLPIAADGSLSAAVTTVSPGMNAHEVVLNTANTVAYVPCLGSDHVAIYDFDASSGALTPRDPVMTASGAGPRHFALSPDGKHAWLMSEKASTVTSFTVASDGGLTAGATISSLPSDFTGDNTGAEIAVHPSGKWVYASNRGHDSIEVFSVGDDGALTLIANTPTGGKDPRHFSLVPGGRALLVANESSDSIDGFHLDPDTGLLTSASHLATVEMVSFVAAVQLP